jgi:phage baseplate assembly protein W
MAATQVPGGPAFPFGVRRDGRIGPETDPDAALRARIVQVLFTEPGERVNLPEFGCGLLGLVFDANDPVLAAATEFTVGQALNRWLGDELVVAGVDVAASGGTLLVEVDYLRRGDLARRSVRIRLG